MMLTSTYHNYEYAKWLPRWRKIDALVSGDIKDYGIWKEHLPVPYVGYDNNDRVIEAKRRNFVRNARLMNVSARTLSTMTGFVSADDNPNIIELPAGNDYLLEDSNGQGIGLMDMATNSVSEVAEFGREGLFVDAGTAETSVDQFGTSGGARIISYGAASILDWSQRLDGSRLILNKVVLLETWRSDDSTLEECAQIRELKLDADGLYYVTVKQYGGKDTGEEATRTMMFEPMIGGRRLDYIPFYFIGAKNNSVQVDTPPLESLVDINYGHLLNSAEVEEAAFYLAPTGMIDIGEMSVDEFRNANPNGITLGAAEVGVLKGGNFQFIQPNPSTLSRELATEKQQQMTAIGGQLINAFTPETAEAARIQKKGDVANIVTIVNNVEKAYRKSVETALAFNGTDQEFVFDMGREFAKDMVISDAALQTLLTGTTMGLVSQDIIDKAIDRKFPSLVEDDTQQ